MLLSLFYASMVDPFYRFNGKQSNVPHTRVSESSSSSQVYFLISRLNFIPFADGSALCPSMIYTASIKLVWVLRARVFMFVGMSLRLGLFKFIKQVK